ncbi:AMP phosphorylase [Candidatus Undinarchaeota archaeon]
MKKKLKVIIFDVDFAKKEIVLNNLDAADLGVRTGSRVRVEDSGEVTSAIVNTTSKFVRSGQIGLFDDVQKALKAKKGSILQVSVLERPESVTSIVKKLNGQKLGEQEIEKIIAEMVDGSLSEVEIGAFVCGLQSKGMEMNEVEVLTRAMAESGDVLDLEGMIFDKHSIGGVPGNKISPIIIPIIASAGLIIPKTSSRAITSPAGTSDVMEVLCPVDLSLDKIKKVVQKTNGCLVWGGAVDLAPADDMMIHIEYPLDIDPRPLLLASIMSKKKAVNADYVVMDIPVGNETKIANKKLGEELARDLIEVGRRVGMQVECALTYGAQPVGHAMGPILEAKEALEVLEGKGHPSSLIEKSLGLAGMILELGGIARKDQGADHAKDILESGDALKKFKEIIKAQGGNSKVKSTDLNAGKYSAKVIAQKRGYVARISNHGVKKIARASGAPKDKGAGVYLEHKIGEKIAKGDVLFTIYSENKEKIDYATRTADILKPVAVESMVLEKIHPHMHIK